MKKQEKNGISVKNIVRRYNAYLNNTRSLCERRRYSKKAG